MATQLDLDDVCAGNPKAEKELAELRGEIDVLKVIMELGVDMAFAHSNEGFVEFCGASVSDCKAEFLAAVTKREEEKG